MRRKKILENEKRGRNNDERLKERCGKRFRKQNKK